VLQLQVNTHVCLCSGLRATKILVREQKGQAVPPGKSGFTAMRQLQVQTRKAGQQCVQPESKLANSSCKGQGKEMKLKGSSQVMFERVLITALSHAALLLKAL